MNKQIEELTMKAAQSKAAESKAHDELSRCERAYVADRSDAAYKALQKARQDVERASMHAEADATTLADATEAAANDERARKISELRARRDVRLLDDTMRVAIIDSTYLLNQVLRTLDERGNALKLADAELGQLVALEKESPRDRKEDAYSELRDLIGACQFFAERGPTHLAANPSPSKPALERVRRHLPELASSYDDRRAREAQERERVALEFDAADRAHRGVCTIHNRAPWSTFVRVDGGRTIEGEFIGPRRLEIDGGEVIRLRVGHFAGDRVTNADVERFHLDEILTVTLELGEDAFARGSVVSTFTERQINWKEKTSERVKEFEDRERQRLFNATRAPGQTSRDGAEA